MQHHDHVTPKSLRKMLVRKNGKDMMACTVSTHTGGCWPLWDLAIKGRTGAKGARLKLCFPNKQPLECKGGSITRKSYKVGLKVCPTLVLTPLNYSRLRRGPSPRPIQLSLEVLLCFCNGYNEDCRPNIFPGRTLRRSPSWISAQVSLKLSFLP